MGGSRKFCFTFLFIFSLLKVIHLSALPSCLDSSTPLPHNVSAAFCPYKGPSCCNSTDDLNIRNQINGMNISDHNCASLVQSILCARCDPFAAELFRINFFPRQVPVICNSTVLPNSTQTTQADSNFCVKVWTTCQNVSMMNSPFSQGQPGGGVKSNFTKLADVWQSQSDFCNAFGGPSEDGGVCFAGEPVILNNTDTTPPPNGLCLEKIGNGSYLNMVPHPDGSNRAFFSNQEGKIWLATIPKQGSGGLLGLDEANPFLDLSDEVTFDTEFGMMGIAVHPNFVTNGRFFASFNCDRTKWPSCGGRCSCNSDLNCDPSQLPPDGGSSPCQYSSVIAEYTVNGSASQPSMAKTALPSEVRRIFTMGLPFTSHHGGQILFGPADGYLYFMMGDGGNTGDPYNFAQNKKSLLGKIMRLDVDSIPSATDISQLGLWGNYSIPKDNPYTEDKDLQPEIWALGLRNPWRCSFDSARPSYFLCADVGQDSYEEVDIITKNGNYGWRTYEGPYFYNPPSSPGGNTSASSINPIFPVMGYNHSAVNKNEESASITGGYFYRSETDPCTFGKYLYADLYAGALWAGIESPENSGNFTSDLISFACASDSPIKCPLTPGSTLPALQYIFSFGEDNNKDIFFLANSGVYRIVRPSRCNYACSKENTSADASPSPASSPPSEAHQLSSMYMNLLPLLSAIWLLLVGLV